VQPQTPPWWEQHPFLAAIDSEFIIVPSFMAITDRVKTIPLINSEAKRMNAAKQQPTALPAARCLPERVNGILVFLDIRPLRPLNPDARREEKEKPNFLPI
jgi:hypothetical protein